MKRIDDRDHATRENGRAASVRHAVESRIDAHFAMKAFHDTLHIEKKEPARDQRRPW